MSLSITCGELCFAESRLSDVYAYTEQSLANDRLGYDTLEFRVWWPEDLSGTAYKTPVTLRGGGADTLQFYVLRVCKCGRQRYEFSCVSAIGLLEREYHFGGLYEGAPLGEVAADICGNLSIEVDADLAGVLVYGWLPIDTRRSNLRQLLFATGGCIRKDASGRPRITAPGSAERFTLPDAAFYTGGSVDYSTPATAVDVTEYGYSETDETCTLFEGAAAAESLVTPSGAAARGVLVTWDEPMHDLAVTGAEILESGANYAVLSDSAACTLTGRRYQCTKVVLRKYLDPDAPDAGNIIVSDSCTLVTLMNSYSVASRLLSYYSAARTVQADLVLGAARPGDRVSFLDPWGDAAEGYIESMDVCLGTTVHRAQSRIVVGYEPGGVGNNYNASELLTGEGSWTVPTGVEVVHLYLLGGGAGGSSGSPGADCDSDLYYNQSTGEVGGRVLYNWNRIRGGSGGAGGAAGEGGRVLELSLTVQPGDVLSFSCGAGGTRERSGAAATAGEATTLQLNGVLYSSADGRVVTGGIRDLFTDAVYGGRGTPGSAGGDGGYGGKIRHTTNPAGAPSGTDGPEDGGAGAACSKQFVDPPQNSPYGTDFMDVKLSSGGGGGGASDTASGGDASGIDGGDGADGGSAAAARPGQGGNGGSGGGGGGGYGCYHYYNENAMAYSSSIVLWAESAGREGRGGAGGEGSDGGAGCVLLYYQSCGVYQLEDALYVRYGVGAQQDGAALTII